jgi:hypothetical protein
MDNVFSGEKLPLSPPTAPTSIAVSLRGFADAAFAEPFANTIAAAVRTISCYINLERLDGITVAFDYDEALAQLDRGYQASKPLTRTGTDQLVGVAMTPAVLRNGAVKSHMVFHAPLVVGLEQPGTEVFRRALYLVAHECGHVEDLKLRDDAFPGTILQRSIPNIEDAILDQVAGVVWEEYAASRVSAIFGEDETAIYERSFTSVLAVARDQANAAIRSYRLHGDINRVLEQAGSPLCEPLRLAAYLIGHLDGLGSDFDLVPQARDQLSTSSYASFVRRLGDALRELWSRRGRWAAHAEFDVLKDIGRDLLADGGMILMRLPGGQLYVDVPFTPNTMPV